MKRFARILLATASCAALAAPAQAADDRARVTALADRFVAAYQEKFPVSYAFSGLAVTRNDGIDINTQADLAAWHATLKQMSTELATISADAFVDQPEWVTWRFLDHALKQDAATLPCRNELWGNVTALGWQASLPQVAGMQPVGTDTARAEALTRWKKFGPWIDTEIANLKDGQRLGYSANAASVRSTIAQLDSLLAGPADKSELMDPATRDKTPGFCATSTWRRRGSRRRSRACPMAPRAIAG
jgi:uncharacterized protein (DUF885 family)